MAERIRKYVYCEVDFIKELGSQIDNHCFGFNDWDQVIALNAIHKLLTDSYIVLHLSLDRTEYCNAIKEVEKKVKRAAKSGIRPQLSYYENFLREIDMHQLEGKLQILCKSEGILPFATAVASDKKWATSIIFLSSERFENHHEEVEDFGVLALSPLSLDLVKILISDNGGSIGKDVKGEWSDIIRINNLPCNSIILIDNFLLNDTEIIEENLSPLLNLFLPKSLCKDLKCEIAVFTSLQNTGGHHLLPEPRIEKLLNIVRDLRPNLSCDITVFKCAEDFHDRNIITNNLFVSCGAGFNLFKKGTSKKLTTVSVISPYWTQNNKWSSQSLSDLLSAVQKRLSDKTVYGENKVDYKFPTYSIGSRNCRLIPEN